MQINFIANYRKDEDPLVAQIELLNYWSKAIENNQIKFIKKAELLFTDYDVSDYPEPSTIKKAIAALGYDESAVEVVYHDLAQSHRVMELTITVEDY